MNILKIPIHSSTDLITNSSTVIFTYSNGCESVLKELVNEMLKTFGINKTYEDVFDAVVLCSNSEQYSDYIAELSVDEYPEGIAVDTDIEALVNDVSKGKLPKPVWFNTVEEAENHYDYFQPETTLYIIPKLAEYERFGQLIIDFLYSTNHEATRD